VREQFRLRDGRRIDWLEYGDPSGVPALYLHGTPSSAREAAWLDAPARAAGVRLIAPDRPGYLDSQARRGERIDGVARDLVELVSGLGVERFAVAGFSGGGGFALAVGAAAPDRVTTVVVGGGMGAVGSAPDSGLPAFTRMLFATAALQPTLSRALIAAPMYWVARRFARDLGHPRQGAASMLRGAAKGAQLEAVDAYIASRSDEQLHAELADRVRSFRSLDGLVVDLAAYAGTWRVDLSALTMPVQIWHGLEDPAVPVGFARALARALPSAHVHLCEGEGHFVFHSHGREVLEAVASSFSAP